MMTSRKTKLTQAGRIPITLSKDLRKLGVDVDKTKEHLLKEAITDLLKKYGRSSSSEE